MILTGKQILKELEKGEIVISPFNRKNLGPNSYDVTFCKKIKIYKPILGCLDMKKDNHTEEIVINEDGYVLEPGILYIGCSNESATSKKFVPIYEGRSSIGRLGISTHVTAGFGDIGWGFEINEHGEWKCNNPTWTLEITVVHPIRVYPNVRIGQVYFIKPYGELSFYKGKYSKQILPQSSMLYSDFNDGNVLEKSDEEII